MAAATLAMGATAGREATTGGSYKLAGSFGKAGTGSGQFSGAHGIAVAANGDVYIADSNNNRIEYFTKGGAYRGKWGTIGTADGQFTGARDVAIGPDGTIWVADDGNSRAQGFSPTGAFKGNVEIPPDESTRAVAVDAEGTVLVAAEGGSLAGFRVYPNGTGQAGTLFGAGAYSLLDVEASPDGTVFLATAASNTADAKVRHFTEDGKKLGTFALPNISGIGVDPDCNLWAEDFANRRVVKYSATGKQLASAAFSDLQGQDIGVAKNGDIYVTQNNGPIVHFTPDRTKPAAAAIPARLTVSTGPVVRIAYALRGVSCPSEIGATATLKGPGIVGTAAGLRLKAGKTNVISMALTAAALKSAAASGTATFRIVLQTNGRHTVETRRVKVVVPASVR